MSEEYLYRADLSYIGKNFTGFQCQPGGTAIQDEIERAFSIFFNKKIKIVGSSRTDSGVHAENQVITFKSDKEFDARKWARGLNALVDNAIGIQSVKQVSDNFHPIISAKAKAYRYRIWRGFCDNPFCKPYVWEVNHDIDIEKMITNCQEFVGKYDFTSFCNTDTDVKTKTREILEIKIDQRGQLVDIWVVGGGFLKQMVRIIVGTLVDQSLGKSIGSIEEIINAKNRASAGRTAPAKGLSLVKVFYENIDPVDKLIKTANSAFTLAI